MSHVPIPSRKGWGLTTKCPPPPRRATYTGNGDKVLWRWLGGADRKLPIAPVARLSPPEDAAMWAWAYERNASGEHVRATRVAIALWRRGYDRSKAGYKTMPASEAYAELARAIKMSGGF